MSIILSVEQAREKINNDGFVCIDVRTKDKNYDTGIEAYQASHLPGAVYLDLRKDLSSKESFFPKPATLAATAGKLGIDEQTPILFYDQGNHRAASRAWVVFHYLGHEKNYILNGGFPAWVKANEEVEKTQEQREQKVYKTNVQTKIDVSIEKIKATRSSDELILIDSRSADRYSGRTEPKYKKAGHIPGAENYHAANLFDNSGQWKDKTVLKEYFSSLADDKEIVVSCGSGNSACLNAVALKESGFADVSIFAGGFSEWISDEANKVQTDDE